MNRPTRRASSAWHQYARRSKRCLLIERLENRELLSASPLDTLVVGDSASDSVQKFDAGTGAYLGSFVPSGAAGLHGPRGMVFDQGNLLLVNQNVDQPLNGEVLRFSGSTGVAAAKLIPSSNPNAPFAPAGMVTKENVVYVADTGEGSPTGRIAEYDAKSGAFLGNLIPNGFNGEFRPRGLVFGPDGGLYASVSSIAETDSSDPPGYILRFDVSKGSYRVVAWNDGDHIDESAQGETTGLHNPVGIVFAPGGTMIVTSNRLDSSANDENTRLLMIDPLTGKELNRVELDPHTTKQETRLVAQAMVFGPDGKLYIPVVVESLETQTASGAIVTYDPATQLTATFFASSLVEQSIILPTYAAFGHTDPATLAYKPWHSFANPLDVSNDGHVSPIDVLRIVNELNTPTVIDAKGKLPSTRGTSNLNYDVTDDGYLTPLDVLHVVNYLNAHSQGKSQTLGEGEPAATIQDTLLIGDSGTDSVLAFDAASGEFVGNFAVSEFSSLHGPRGMVFDQGNLLLVNQNVDQPINGEVLRFNGSTGLAAGKLIPSSNPNAPFAPAGIVVKDNIVYVADTGEGSPTGRIAMMDATTGEFRGALIPNDFGPEFRPRGLVFGPDGGLYVTVSSIEKSDTLDPPGHILRFDVTTGRDRVVAWNDGDGRDDSKYGEAVNLHNPGGIVFAPDGTLFVTSNRIDLAASADQNTQIVMIDPSTRKELSHFQLSPTDNPESTRLFAQAMLFGPNGKLFIPVLVESLTDRTTAGTILTYDPATKHTSTFFANSAVEQTLSMPSYLTFRHTDAATLAYVLQPIPQATVLSDIETTPISFTAQAPATLVSKAIRVGDKDSATLTRATIRVSSNYHNGEDLLTFSDTQSIQGSWDTRTGILTLEGNASLATYQSALRSVRYQNASSNPSVGPRLIEFQVSDGELSSNPLTRRIQVTSALVDRLFIGDQGNPMNPNDDSVKQFDISNGRLIGSAGAPGQLIGPRGMVVSQDVLLVANQNVDQPINGDVLGFDNQSGLKLNVLIPPDSPQAPFAPRGIVVKDNVIYVADAEGASGFGPSVHPINKYDATTGEFLGELVPKACFGSELNPRGLVFGPDGNLYASYFAANEFTSSDPPGYIIRFLDTTTGEFEIVAANRSHPTPGTPEFADLHNPEGIVFGPDGRLYVTSYRDDSSNNGIVVLDVTTKSEVGFISLGQNYAQALMFGPNDQLYVPITGGGDATGSVRVYDPATANFSAFVAPFSDLQQPWYLTFNRTNPATLAYQAD